MRRLRELCFDTRGARLASRKETCYQEHQGPRPLYHERARQQHIRKQARSTCGSAKCLSLLCATYAHLPAPRKMLSWHGPRMPRRQRHLCLRSSTPERPAKGLGDLRKWIKDCSRPRHSHPDRCCRNLPQPRQLKRTHAFTKKHTHHTTAGPNSQGPARETRALANMFQQCLKRQSPRIPI